MGKPLRLEIKVELDEAVLRPLCGNPEGVANVVAAIMRYTEHKATAEINRRLAEMGDA